MYHTNVYYHVYNRYFGRIHLYWYTICADTQKEFDRIRLFAIDESIRMKKALSKERKHNGIIKIEVTFK